MLKKIIRKFVDTYYQKDFLVQSQLNDANYSINSYVSHAIPTIFNFNYNVFGEKILTYVDSLNVENGINHRYSSSVPHDTIYGSMYACMIKFLLNKTISQAEKESWITYFNQFQNEEGYFIDKKIECENYYNLDWWGANHLSLHLIICYTYLDAKPKYEFNYIKKFYEKSFLLNFLGGLDFNDIYHKDADNALMNIGTILQYQRDFFNDEAAAKTLSILLDELEKKINPKWGSWGYFVDSIDNLSRSQQFAYHLYPLWLYDKRPIKHTENLIDLTLKTQNIWGGFGANLNSSACEDIDAVFVLIKLSENSSYRQTDVKVALQKALVWILANQNEDGGFVFRRNQSFVYGHPLTSSQQNESNLFATWFRLLSLSYLLKKLEYPENFQIGRCPGLQF